MWSFARDKAFPFSTTWAKVNHRLGVPLNAHIACNAIVVLLGALYIASATGTLHVSHSDWCSVQFVGDWGDYIPVFELFNSDYPSPDKRSLHTPSRTILPGEIGFSV
jgi:hypothetical protein